MLTLTPERLRNLEDGELLALFAGAIALPTREPADVELIDAIGREFRERKQPDDVDEWARCKRCSYPWLAHDQLLGCCPSVDAEAHKWGEENMPAEEWERVRPYIFGQEPVT